MNKTYGISFEEGLLKRLDDAAWRLRLRRSEYVRQAVEESLQKETLCSAVTKQDVELQAELSTH